MSSGESLGIKERDYSRSTRAAENKGHLRPCAEGRDPKRGAGEGGGGKNKNL